MAMAMSSEKNQKTAQLAIEKRRFESSVQFAQVCALRDGRGLIVGTADNDRPGSIMVFRLEGLTRVFDIQAHSLPISRMALNFEQTHLFTGSNDGTLGFWEVKDQMQKRDKEQFQIILSKEILTERTEMAELMAIIEQFEHENKQMNIDNEIAYQSRLKDKEQMIETEKEQLEADKRKEEKKRADL